jgi:hypothetical protein
MQGSSANRYDARSFKSILADIKAATYKAGTTAARAASHADDAGKNTDILLLKVSGSK